MCGVCGVYDCMDDMCDTASVCAENWDWPAGGVPGSHCVNLFLRCGCSMSGGELFDRLVQRGAYSEVEARDTFKQFAQGLQYLHKCVVVVEGVSSCCALTRLGVIVLVAAATCSPCLHVRVEPQAWHYSPGLEA